MIEFKKHVWAEISLDAIAKNIANFRTLTDSRIIAVIKANAYGHGALETANQLLEIGVDCFAVASLREAIELRKGGINGKILILGYTSPEDCEALVEYSISQAVFSKDYAEALANNLKTCNRKLNIHLKLNTGMNRLGFDCKNTSLAIAEITEILRQDCFRFEGIFTHFASADRGGDPNLSFTELQANRFMEVCEGLKTQGYDPEIRHCCNSAGIVTMPKLGLDAVRLGISLYGLTPDTELELPIELSPAMSLKATVAMVHSVSEGDTVSYGRTWQAPKDSLLATVSIGYADGYPRLLSDRGEVLINGRRCKIVGRVCMDQLVVDVSHIPSVKSGDEVVLIGKQGEETISAEEVASLCNTINYEIVCGISRRVPRYYFKNNEFVSVTDYISKEK